MLKIKIVVLLVLIFLGLLLGKLILGSRSQKTTYETETAQKGTLITSISGSGSITSGNNTSLSTKVSGVVQKVYVTNGDTVTKGQKIADIFLDDYAKERQTAAWVSYLEATENARDAIAAKSQADIAMWQARQEVLTAQEAYNNNNGIMDNPGMIIIKTLDQKRKAFSVAEAKYLNSGADIANAHAKVSAALRNYQENSATIVAPVAGVISDLALAPNLVIAASSTTSNTSGATIVSAQTIGKITNPTGQLIASVSLSEIDIITVKPNQKVSLTLDAYPDKTFTGKVLSVNTNGTVSSSVTNYPVTILLDPVSVEIYPNMSVDVNIITSVKSDVILIPTTAITTTNGESTVQVKKNNQITTVQVITGSSNDSQTEITSGITVGDEVVTSVIIPTSSDSTSNTTSPFNGIGRSGTGSNSRNSIRTIQMGGPGGF
jgi:multidrug efflux pump subunit AcrA (membrane-fusion protein)